jgi:hypothetical protein
MTASMNVFANFLFINFPPRFYALYPELLQTLFNKSSKILLGNVWFLSYFNNYFQLHTQSSWSRGNTDIFIFSKVSISALGPTQPHL